MLFSLQGSIELTGNSSLQGKKDNGIDDYTGTYQADYKACTGTEYLFGGTSIKREAGKDIAVTCTLEVTSGTAKIFWISGADEAVTYLKQQEHIVILLRFLTVEII